MICTSSTSVLGPSSQTFLSWKSDVQSRHDQVIAERALIYDKGQEIGAKRIKSNLFAICIGDRLERLQLIDPFGWHCASVVKSS